MEAIKSMLCDEMQQEWSLEKKLGEGGYASVFLATTPSGHVAAVKSTALFSSSSSSSSSVIASKAESLLKESHILRALRGSPCIIGSYGDQIATITDDDGKEEAYLNVFLEYASAGTLFDLLRSHPRGLPEPEVQVYTASILEGLHHIHQHDLMHCDIKPANILLAPSFSTPFRRLPKIADFGLAKLVGDKLPQKKDKFRGTPPYLAPESVSRGEYEPPCDVWAIGCVVLELLTGCAAWGRYATSKSTLLHVIVSTSLLPKLPAHLSDDAKDFLSKCLVRDPEHRWSCEMLLSHPFLATTGGHQMLKRHRGVKRSMPEVSYTGDFHTDGEKEDSAEETVDYFPDYIPLQREKRRKTTSKAVKEVPRLPSYISINSKSDSSSWRSSECS